MVKKKKKKKKKKFSYMWCYDNNVHVTAVVCPQTCMEQPQNVCWPRPGPRMSAPTGAPTHTNSLENSSVQTPHTHTADTNKVAPDRKNGGASVSDPPTLTPSQQLEQTLDDP